MHTSNSLNISILGAGSWGMALAKHCQHIGHSVNLWEFDSKAAEKLQQTRMRPELLPGVTLNKDILVTSDLGKAVKGADIILLVVPSHVSRSVLKNLAAMPYPKGAALINCTKGIEIETLNTISQIVEQEIPHFRQRYAVLSGPSHAEEVAKDIPTAVVVASADEIVARFVQQSLNGRNFRIYRSSDVIGVELGGSLKNVIAIAAGICDGAGFGDNTKAALQPRGLAEMARLGKQLGASTLTFAGLSGMGDLIVTCMSKHSRNRFVGEEIGKGKSLQEVLDSMKMVAEGVKTSKAAKALSQKMNVEMPISSEVYNILFENKDPKSALHDLISREVKPEFWF